MKEVTFKRKAKDQLEKQEISELLKYLNSTKVKRI